MNDESGTLLAEDELRAIDVEGPGYTIKDGFLGTAALAALRDEVCKIYEEGQLHPAAMVSRHRRRWEAPNARGDLQLWLNVDNLAHGWWADWPHLRAACARLLQVHEELYKVWGFGQGRVQAQLACYPGGGARYVRHLDAGGSDSDTSAQRRLTLLYYINPKWTVDDGGCLRLYPQNQQDKDREAWVDVAPLGDRLLIFQSRTIEHEVLPSQGLRFSLTIWLY